ncbi:phage phi-r73 primase-like protein [Canicola haemoglobinophilus]|nr:phage phi-r73 primase-like protein [Canicola haemoglobinophilus]
MKLKNAPNLNKQPNAPFDDLIILAGNRAWNAWSKGNGTE